MRKMRKRNGMEEERKKIKCRKDKGKEREIKERK